MNTERNYLRRSYRINLPAYVFINSKKYEAKDWSFLGFRISGVNDDIKVGKIYTIKFELPFAGFDLQFEAEAECKWKREDEAGFEFKELSDETKMIMKEYVEAYVEGRLQNAGGLLKAAEGVEIPIDTSTVMSEEERKKLDKILIRRVIIYAFLFIGLAFLIYQIYQNRNVVYSAEAFISGNNFDVLSPIDGEIEKINISLGEKINKNTLIAKINNTEISNKIKETNTSYVIAQKKLLQLKQLLKQTQKSIETADLNIKKSKVSILKSIEILNKTLKEKEKLLKKYEKLYQLGLIDETKIENIKSQIANLKLKIITLKSKLESNTLTYPQIATIKIEILNQEEKINNLLLELEYLKSILKKTYIYSPYEGIVLNVYKKPHDLIRQYEILASINIDTSKTYTIARFKLKDATKIYIGDKAKIYIPSLDKYYKGKVVAIGTAALIGNIKPTEKESYLRKDIPVKIEILNPDEKLIPGIIAEVELYGQ
jgi:multidrug resistance efflux pump